MIAIEKEEVFNFEGAFRGLRNPLNSWEKSDSRYTYTYKPDLSLEKNYKLGDNDLKLARRMIKGGTDESKFMRQILVSLDITAPLYW